MKKTLLVIVALVMALALVIGSFSTVSAAAPTTPIATITGHGTFDFPAGTLGNSAGQGNFSINAKQTDTNSDFSGTFNTVDENNNVIGTVNLTGGAATGLINFGMASPGGPAQTGHLTAIVSDMTESVYYDANNKVVDDIWWLGATVQAGSQGAAGLPVVIAIDVTNNQLFFSPTDDPSDVFDFSYNEYGMITTYFPWFQINHGSVSVN